MINEIVQSFDDHFSIELNSTKKHRGQQVIANAMRNTLADSKLIEKRGDHFIMEKLKKRFLNKKYRNIIH